VVSYSHGGVTILNTPHLLLAALGMLNWGNMIGWTNVASPHLRGNETGFEMEDDGSSWVGSTIAFGAIFGSIFAGWKLKRIYNSV
jgi:hypothetical protein